MFNNFFPKMVLCMGYRGKVL